jgi:site-specific recombinase XerD
MTSSSLIPIPRRDLGRAGIDKLPAPIARAGEEAAWRFIEFFTANIRDRNTPAAYARALTHFFEWCEARRVDLDPIYPVTVVTYVKQHPASPSTVKQVLAAIRIVFDYLVTGKAVPINPAACVRGPKYVVKRGRTPALKAGQARQLLHSTETDTTVGLRHRPALSLIYYWSANPTIPCPPSCGKRYWFS